MPYTAALLAMALIAGASGCSSRYGKPAAHAPAPSLSQSSPAHDLLIVTGLVEFRDSFPLRHHPSGAGQLTIWADGIEWANPEDSDRSFSIRPEVVKAVTMECVLHRAGNLCLELDIETVTGITYQFRDRDWAGGYNREILRARNHLELNFPRIVFAEKTVDVID